MQRVSQGPDTEERKERINQEILLSEDEGPGDSWSKLLKG